jgi:hypothetical protein
MSCVLQCRYLAKKTLLVCFLLPAAMLPAASVADDFPESRDPWLWPFSASSIWNMPIGDGAIYKEANLESAEYVGVDIQHLLRLDPSDPQREVLDSPTWGPGR